MEVGVVIFVIRLCSIARARLHICAVSTRFKNSKWLQHSEGLGYMEPFELRTHSPSALVSDN